MKTSNVAIPQNRCISGAELSARVSRLSLRPCGIWPVLQAEGPVYYS